MDDEIMNYKAQLEAKLTEKPIWEKACLTIEEAAEYSGIGRRKLRQLSKQKQCPFVMPLGNQIFIVRERLDTYMKTHRRI